eukprot:12268325-Karenia_brevis.AAC.1
MCDELDLATRLEFASAAALLGLFGRPDTSAAEDVMLQHALQQSAIYAIRAKSGLPQDLTMEPADIELLFALKNSITAEVSIHPERRSAHSTSDVYHFIPTPVLRALEQHYPNPEQLGRVLKASWIQDWK